MARYTLILTLLIFLAGCNSSGRIKEAADKAALEAAKKAEEEAKRQLGNLATGPLSMAALTGFAPGKAVLKASYFRAWYEQHRNTLFSTVQGLPEGSALVVVGHSDPLGGEALADRLARQRAEYVARELVRLGIPPQKITTQSMAARELANPNFPGAGENRRVTFQTGGNAQLGAALGAMRSALPEGLPGALSTAPDVSTLNAELAKLTMSGFTSARSGMTRSYENMWLSRIQPLLPQIRAALASGYSLEVAGHSDPFGGYQKAERFGRQRANYVAGLLRRNGIPSRSMQVLSKAANEMANPNFVGAAENRRVTLKLVSGYRTSAPAGLPIPAGLPTSLPVPSGIPDYTSPGY